jgi:IS605 OrfB family transposase
MYPTLCQKQILDGFIDTHRYVYNRTLEYIKKLGYDHFFQPLRNMLASERTRSLYSATFFYNMYLSSLRNNPNISKEYIKSEEDDIEKELQKLPLLKNPMIYDFELNTSNEIRSNAIKSVCDAYKTGKANLQAGNIKFFNISFKKKTAKKKCIELAKTDIAFTDKGIKISPTKFPNNEKIIKINKNMLKKYKNLVIKHNCDLVKVDGKYFIHITLDTNVHENKKVNKYCGIDPGIRSFISIYEYDKLTSIDIKSSLLEKLNKKINLLKKKRIKPLLKSSRTGYRKKQITKIDNKKSNLINTIHWDTINYLVKTQDVIFFGDIKSHNIVKGNKNKTNNRMFNDLKFYKFKQRLLYKCITNKRKVFFINEAYTSQCCSSCGDVWRELGNSKEYICQNQECKMNSDRDFNAAKNIFMKGVLC